MKRRFEVPYSDPKWWWEGSFIPICFECEHFQGMINGKARCNVFSDGISKEIISSKYDEHNHSACLEFNQYLHSN